MSLCFRFKHEIPLGGSHALPAQQEKHSAGQALQGYIYAMETVMQSFGMQAFCYVLYFAPLTF
jgi:hypothetical protein